MPDPILRKLLPVQRRALDVNVCITRVKIHISDRRRVTSSFVANAHFFEERRRDEVHVLACVGEDAHHSQSREGAHGAAVIIAWNAIDGVIEL